jgi:hypothetical protein
MRAERYWIAPGSITMFMATLLWLPRSSQLRVIKNPVDAIGYGVFSVSRPGLD